jgi:hypothetical protein
VFLSSAPSHRRCPPPHPPPATHASHAFSDERWGKGRTRGGGGIIGIEGRGGGRRWVRRDGNGIFSTT